MSADQSKVVNHSQNTKMSDVHVESDFVLKN